MRFDLWAGIQGRRRREDADGRDGMCRAGMKSLGFQKLTRRLLKSTQAGSIQRKNKSVDTGATAPMTDNHPTSVHTAPLCRLPTLTDGPHSDRLTRLLAARPHLAALSLEAPLPLLLPLPPHLPSPNTKNVSKHAPHVPRRHLAQPLPALASRFIELRRLRPPEQASPALP